MNERIRLLWEEAAKTTQGDSWEEQTKFLEKFAELIVRECLTIVERKEYSYHEADPLWETAELIREHFGVE